MEHPPSTEAHTDRSPCRVCGTSVDVLRAPALRLVDGRFLYYCSRECSERAGRRAPTRRAQPIGLGATPPGTDEVIEMLGLSNAALTDAARKGEPSRKRDDDPRAERDADEPSSPIPPALALASAIAASLFAAVDSLSLGPRVTLVAVAAAVALGSTLRELWKARGEVGAVGWTVGAVGAALPSVVALRVGADALVFGLRDTALLAALGPVVTWSARTHRVAAQSRLESFRSALPQDALIANEAGSAEPERILASKVHAGREVLVGAGEAVPVDGVITEGEAEIRPWPGAETTIRRGRGTPVLAGARVLGGRLRVLATRAGDEVAWARLARMMNDVTEGPRTVKLARRLAELVPVGVVGTAAVTALLRAFFAAGDVPRAVASVLALAPCALAARVVEIPFIDALVLAARRGIVFRDAASVEAVGAVGTVALSMRGTVTQGTMELTDVVSLGPRSEAALLARVAGCEEPLLSDPFAASVALAARARGVRAESVRRPTSLGGHGVLAVSASGEPIVVGNTHALLGEGISVAQGEAVASAIEGTGRTVVYVASDGRLEGVIGFEDPVRAEARASLQSLIDAGFDVALISGASRATLEAIAATIDVSNIRPEVPPNERAAVVRGLSEIGGGVAVIGRPARDGAALSAADAAISLDAAGAGGGETAVALASDDLRGAADSLVLARRARDRALRVIALGIGGVGAGAFAAAAIPTAAMYGVLGAAAAILAGQAILLRGGTEEARS